jgi:DNA-binding transcriptional MerR regulator
MAAKAPTALVTDTERRLSTGALHLDKAPDAFRTISEVADDLDVPQHVLRFWETRFTQIKPMKRSGGRRYYRPDDVNLLRGIRRLLYGEGYTIRGVQRILREHGIKSVQSLTDGSADHARPCSTARHSMPRRTITRPIWLNSKPRTEDEVEADAAADEQEESRPSPLSLRDLGPPLSGPDAPERLWWPSRFSRPFNGSSGAEAYAPPNIGKCAPDGSRQAQAALDDLIGARA